MLRSEAQELLRSAWLLESDLSRFIAGLEVIDYHHEAVPEIVETLSVLKPANAGLAKLTSRLDAIADGQTAARDL